MKIIPTIIALLLCCLASHGSRLSPDAQVSLITCQPGKEFYEAFGHTAIRIYDPVRGFDKAYNYGIFDFDRPDFYTNFAKGNLIYMLGVYSYPRFASSYIGENRSVTEQVLNLTVEKKQSIYDYLEDNSQPSKREYTYHYFFNNCSTKPRDVIEAALGNKLHYDYSFIKKRMTIRQLVDECTEENSWGDFGIDLALSHVIDRPATDHEYLFIPEELMKAVALATISDSSGTKPLVATTNKVYVAQAEPPLPKDVFSPLTVCWGIFLIVLLITIFNVIKGKPGFWFDSMFFSVIGLLGLIMALISFFTNHESSGNYNLLWALPFHLIAAFLLPFKRVRKWLKYYFLISGIILLVLLAFWWILPQDLHYAVVPIILALLLRCANVWYYENKAVKAVLQG
ncbi:MAG: DUF4105 domain-containing protein [Chitinophagales bacterium]|nr:DUF4105 domain-containing protein [Chitinophagales bacterium]